MNQLTVLIRDQLRLYRGQHPPRRRLESALADLAEGGALASGARLPSERELAQAVGLSRGTVAAALNALCDLGLLQRRQGSGTFVTDSVVGHTTKVSHWLHPGAVFADLAKAVVPDTSHLDVSSLDPAELLRTPSQHGYDSMGDAHLRTLLQELDPTEGDILITSGAQQGIDLITRAFVRGGDTVLVEDLTYPGALSSFRRAGAEVVPVATDDHGLVPEAFHREIVRHRPVFAYIMGVHNPTGTQATPDRISELAQLARAEELLIVEDRTLAELVYDGMRPPFYATHFPRGTITLNSLSKVLWGGLRVGWLRADASLLAPIVEIKQDADLATSIASQRMAAFLLENNTIDDWRHELVRRRNHTMQALRTELPAWLWNRPRAGLSMWVRIPGVDADGFVRLARHYGVAIAPGSIFSPYGRHRDYLRMSFTLPPEIFNTAVKALACAWHHHLSGNTSTRRNKS